MSSVKQIGTIEKEIIDLLELDMPTDLPILIGESNEQHIKNRHPVEYDKYFNQIEDIVSTPDYVGYNKKNDSITYVKKFVVASEYIQVAVRVSKNKKAYAKTLFMLNTYKVESYIKKGRLKKV